MKIFSLRFLVAVLFLLVIMYSYKIYQEFQDDFEKDKDRNNNENNNNEKHTEDLDDFKIRYLNFENKKATKPPKVYVNYEEEDDDYEDDDYEDDIKDLQDSFGKNEKRETTSATTAPKVIIKKPLEPPDNIKKMTFEHPPTQKYFEEVVFLELFEYVREKPKLKGKNLEEVKIALVKQDVYTNLYCQGQSRNGSEIVNKTLKHQGPVGFFSPSLMSTFIIVSTDFNSKETSIWKEKVEDCHFPGTVEEMFEKRQSVISVVDKSLNGCNQTSLSLDETKVNWLDYDIVVSVDIAVSRKITEQYPEVVWAYFITEGCMDSYRSSLTNPIDGYDLFLTQNFNMNVIGSLKPHVIEFPFTFSYAEVFHDIHNLQKPMASERSGIILCRGHDLSDDQIIKIEQITNEKVEEMWGTPTDLMRRFMKAKYFIYSREKGVSNRGNAVAEAIAGGCLTIASLDNITNKDLMKLSNTLIKSWDELEALLKKLSEDPQEYQKYLRLQHKMFDYLLFNRPLYQLIERSSAVLNSRGIS